jgi:hypothetical protein
VCLPDDGMEESWYEAEVMDLRQGQGHAQSISVLVAVKGLLSEAEGNAAGARAVQLQVGGRCARGDHMQLNLACGLADTSCARACRNGIPCHVCARHLHRLQLNSSTT